MRASFIHSLVLAEPAPDPPAVAGAGAQATGVSGCVSSGSVVSFVSALPPGARSDVLDSTLLAQLAANGAVGREDLPAWYADYVHTLSQLTWRIGPLIFSQYSLSGSSVPMDDIARALLAGVAPASGAQAVHDTIGALVSQPADASPLALFDHSSRLSSGGSFQVQVALGAGDSTVTMYLGAVYFSTATPPSAVLTAELPAASTVVQTAVQTATLDLARYAVMRDDVRQKLGSYTSTYIANVHF